MCGTLISAPVVEVVKGNVHECIALLDAVRTLLARHLFSPLQGTTAGNWWRLLVRHRFAIDPRYWPRAAFLTLAGLQNSTFARLEEWRYGRLIEAAEVQPPLFILGHYRSGTTHLHNLLSIDPQFATPTLLQAMYPHTFLTAGKSLAPFAAVLMIRRRPQDEMTVAPGSPAEDEFALCVATALSPYMGWVFPRTSADYDQYLTFRGVQDEEVAAWKTSFTRFLKKLTLAENRPILLKSPPHTGRVRLLLELFPQVRFINIHRHPYAVFASTRHLWRAGPPAWQLQRTTVDEADIDSRIIRNYKVMYDAYFADRSLTPPGQFCEVRYEELEREPVRVVEAIYNALGLAGFASIRGSLQSYLHTIVGYRKNEYPKLPEPLRERIASEWHRSFYQWCYAR